jgi:hypothetical protein
MSDDLIPVLDADEESGSVIGWASNPCDAAKIIFVHRRDATGDDRTVFASEVQIRREPVTYDPDINKHDEAEAVERLGAYVAPEPA